ncbi:MAG: alcohol dehydrogenase catalytic domain-containing protein [Armatimonadota bacterium]|nr:alcohol dehydrogenase catalytic domain-containing protein [Armatimonadota bacterium]MDR7436061.1 alcohol dehydrogenase catalytic domain-containing protein [Armatimonadota bacterium]MDR7471940.1 alcohol dehydrogenase catalytic domain-containing protein [Armatimonadota bacterium]MDR7507052.1 alcohol dehydrogenase catalytic domain-containing protein [Armatimonadota bacterium]MDR7508596.1 alcohol dehydrogenase catalytic domain-containing protein [Armatimonadota bacterium]
MGVETLPATTRAVVYRGPSDLRVEEVPLQPPQAGELLVRVRACGLCPGEVMDWYMARKAPLVPGHEVVAEVVRAGAGAEAFAPGDRVFVHHHAPCLACRACRRGDYVHCPTFRRTRLVPGGLAEYALVPAEIVRADVRALPPALSDEAATFVEPLACAVKACRRAGLGPGDRVVVIGLGVMGLLHVLLARRLGAEVVVGADRVPSRLRRAAALGATVVDVGREDLSDAVRGRTGGDGADVVVVGPGTVEALESGLSCAAPGGTVVVFTPTPPEARWPLPVHDLYFREVRIVPSYSAGPPDTAQALRYLAEGLPVEDLVTHRLPLEQAAEGYRLVRQATDALKVVVRP